MGTKVTSETFRHDLDSNVGYPVDAAIEFLRGFETGCRSRIPIAVNVEVETFDVNDPANAATDKITFEDMLVTENCPPGTFSKNLLEMIFEYYSSCEIEFTEEEMLCIIDNLMKALPLLRPEIEMPRFGIPYHHRGRVSARAINGINMALAWAGCSYYFSLSKVLSDSEMDHECYLCNNAYD